MKLGIDFGTSFSLPATVFMGQKMDLLPAGRYGIPSLFFYSREEGILIGDQAEEAGQGRNAAFLRREIKMQLNNNLPITLDGKRFTPEDMVGHMLRHIKDTAVYAAQTNLIDSRVEGAVVSVPAAFSNNEKELIRRALERPVSEGGAGIPFLGFIKEPVAAAIAYFDTSLEDNTSVLVFDLGGGTCDVAIVTANSREREKYSVADSEMLRIGGKDWDEKLANYIIYELEHRTGVPLANNPMYLERVKRAAIQAKHKFSEKGVQGYPNKVRVHVDVDGSAEAVVITKEMFDETTMTLAHKVTQLAKQLYEKHPELRISKLVCVGGGSNMPQVIDRLKAALPRLTCQVYQPSKAIAYGAAVYAQTLQRAQPLLRDIAAFSYGIRVYRDYAKYHGTRRMVMNFVKKGDTLPASGVDYIVTPRPNMSMLEMRVFESEECVDSYDYHSSNEDAILLVEFPLPPNTPVNYRLEVTLTLTKDGLLEVVAKDAAGRVRRGSKKLQFH